MPASRPRLNQANDHWQARAYLQLESYDDAASDLERVVELDPSQAYSLSSDIAQVYLIIVAAFWVFKRAVLKLALHMGLSEHDHTAKICTAARR